jgi:hypothetical protein
VHRLYAYAVSVAALLIIGWPATRNPDADGFPLSTYPMFARPKGRIADITSALAIGADGANTPIPPRYIANAETMQAIRTLHAAVAQGSRRSRELCEAIAERLKTARAPELRDAVRVELVSGSVDTIDYLAGRATPPSRRLHARCDVRRELP